MEFMKLSCTPSQSIPLGGNSWSYFIMGGAVWQCGGKLTVTLNVPYEGSNAICKKASHGNKTELYSVTCLHTMLEICAHSGGLPIRYKVII